MRKCYDCYDNPSALRHSSHSKFPLLSVLGCVRTYGHGQLRPTIEPHARAVLTRDHREAVMRA
jgi:hypothetical protein